jgi:hypothetical protein
MTKAQHKYSDFEGMAKFKIWEKHEKKLGATALTNLGRLSSLSQLQQTVLG